MGFKALVTLDLPDLSNDKKQREIFYQVLEDEKWIKIPDLNTAWEIILQDEVSRMGAINMIKKGIKKAKEKSEIKKVYYAIQVDINDLIIDKLI